MNTQYNTILFIVLLIIGLVILFLLDKKYKPWQMNKEILNFRTIAILPIIFFTPTLIIAIVSPDSKIGDVLGILFHLSAMILVSKMPSFHWAKAAGYGWLVLDIACGAMIINNVPMDIAMPVRLGGHILGAMWIIPTSLLCKQGSIKVIGAIAGLWLALYTFFGDVLPMTFLAPSGLIVIIWFGLLAVNIKDIKS